MINQPPMPAQQAAVVHRSDSDRHSQDSGRTSGGHAGHAGDGDHSAQFRDRFWWSLALAVPVVAFSPMFADLVGYEPPSWTSWISPALGTIIFVYGGRPFLVGAVAEIRSRRPGMMLLVAMAISVAFVASALTTLQVGGFDLDFWWELALLVVIMLLGHWLEMRALGQASGALDALAALLPDEADLVTKEGAVRSVAVGALQVGDVVLVRPGARVPADGRVLDGRTHVDESMITGESRAVARSTGDRVVAGTIATDSAIRVRIEAVGEQTALAGIRRLVEQAQGSHSHVQALADRAAAALFYFAAGAGLLTFLVWLLLGEPQQAIERAVTVLVIACPHALGLAIPLVIAISTATAAKAGILVKDRLALERMRQVDTVLFDKTGTLTIGRPAVTNVVAADGGTADLLALAAAVESDSEHPLAGAIVTAAARRGPIPAARDFVSLPGRGVQADVNGQLITVGGPAVLADLQVPEVIRSAADEWSLAGTTVVFVLRRSGSRTEVLGALALSDDIRPESAPAVRKLQARGLRVAMITGDSWPVARAVARRLGLDDVVAQVLPVDKDAAVAELQANRHRIAMVGDGVNDAPALARADVGIAIGAGTDVAIESAGVVLAANDPRLVDSVIALSTASYRKMQQNLGWAVGYNLVSVPLAAGVLAPIGIVLPPAVGAILMSLSTIIVATNAQLLRKLRLVPPPD